MFIVFINGFVRYLLQNETGGNSISPHVTFPVYKGDRIYAEANYEGYIIVSNFYPLKL